MIYLFTLSICSLLYSFEITPQERNISYGNACSHVVWTSFRVNNTSFFTFSTKSYIWKINILYESKWKRPFNVALHLANRITTEHNIKLHFFQLFLGDFLRWLNTADTKGQILGIEFAEEYFVWCALIYSMRYYGQLVSSWLTVAITVERFIGVAFPLKASQICTKTKTNIVISIIWLLSIGLSCFPFWTLRINSAYGIKWCEYKNQEEFDRWSWAIIRIMSLILPSIIIFVFTGLIIYKLQKITRNRAEMSRLTSKGKKQTLERQLTIMLIAVSVTFLILRLPYVITYYMFDFRHDFWGEEIGVWFEYRLWLARDICDVFATANYAINFFLYCLTGSQFRSNIKSCIRCESVRAIRLKKYRSTFRSNTALTVHNSNHSSNSSLNGISNGAIQNAVNLQSNGIGNGAASHSNGVSKRTSVSIV